MNPATSSYITVIAASGALNLLLCIYAYMKKSDFNGMKTFFWATLTAAVYSFGTALQLASSTLGQIKFWLGLTYGGMVFSPPCFLLLILQYTGLYGRVHRRWIRLLFLIPSITCVLVATNDWHHFYYQSIFLLENTPSPMAGIVMGPWYVIQGVVTFGTMFLGVCVLVHQWRYTARAYRKQIITLILGLLLPITASFLYLLGFIPYDMDPVPFILIVTTSLYVWAIRTTDLFNVVPIARAHVFESMRDGVLVLDKAQRLVDYNRAAARMIPSLAPSSIGSYMEQIWSDGGAAAPLDLEGHRSAEGQNEPWRVLWRHQGETVHYEIRALPVQVRHGQQVGQMLMLIDVTESVRTEEKLRYLATYDGLTGIYNRTYFMELASELLAAACETESPLALILVDIDHFKRINDRLGHHMGDRALVHLVQLCKLHLGDGDLLGRYGGEEFVLCLPGETPDSATRRMELLRAEIASTPMAGDREQVHMTASFGVVEAGTPGRAYKLEALLQAADRALYEAKGSGRNAVRSYREHSAAETNR